MSKSVKNKSDISHAASEVSIDINSVEEESNVVECCRRKRKRCDLECDNFRYEVIISECNVNTYLFYWISQINYSWYLLSRTMHFVSSNILNIVLQIEAAGLM